MIGSIIGDVIGSVYEAKRTKETDFPLFSKKTDFTDDTVLTMATIHALLYKKDYGLMYKKFATYYPDRGYGGNFGQWIKSAEMLPAYDSWGNGSAMRVSPVGYFFDTEEEVLKQAKLSAECTHNHPEGIKGAQATALAIHYAKIGLKKETIRATISEMFDYNLNRTVDEIRPDYQFKESCQETVPEAIIAFLDSTDFESTIRLAISLGGDSDTLACIAGGIAEAYYKDIPDKIIDQVVDMLPANFVLSLGRFYLSQAKKEK